MACRVPERADTGKTKSPPPQEAPRLSSQRVDGHRSTDHLIGAASKNLALARTQVAVEASGLEHLDHRWCWLVRHVSELNHFGITRKPSEWFVPILLSVQLPVCEYAVDF